MPSVRRILTQARSLNRSLAHSSDSLLACRRNFTSSAMAKGRSEKARVQYLSAAVASVCQESKPESLAQALELSETWSQRQALDELRTASSGRAPAACLRRWMTLWRSTCKELALGTSDALGQENCLLPLLEQPREMVIRSRRLGELTLVQLGRGLFGFRCPQGGLHLPRTLVHPALHGPQHFLWNWPLLQGKEPLTLLPLVCLERCNCASLSTERFELNLHKSVGCS